MSEILDFKDRDIDYEINLKCNSIDTVRAARINTSKRLYEYAEKWELIFLAMSIMSTGLLVYSLINPENKDRLALSALFSIYSLLVQNFVAKLNYNERALKLHYHQLELEDFLLDLKSIIFQKSLSDDEKINKYQQIMSRYQISLRGNENHSDFDHKYAKKYQKRKYGQGNSQSDMESKVTEETIEDGKKKCCLKDAFLYIEQFIKRHDFSWNKIIIWFQYILIPLVLIWYLFLS
ncbi:SLATT domain-containing protein [Streptococcus sp. 1343]|uniref:SLATT domain-containing protein n=1 Tax=Streptococcus sp. 1343 TaxID=2582641 RepID=UPI001562B42A